MPVPTQEAQPHVVLHHRGLETTFRGIEHRLSEDKARIHQFRGIKYASIPARFRQSQLFSSYAPITDATSYGPICPQKRPSKSIEETLFGIPREEIPTQKLKQDEFECLNLNITSPAGLIPYHSRVPVMLWVHGGGERGSGSQWYYDPGAIVRKSIVDHKPVIFVTFNYRIGILGFAASPIIREDNRAAGEEGTGNYGLRDQRKALEWLHHNIAEFGGDPNNITLAGNGSGAAAIVCHLLSRLNETRPLFHRAIIQSPVFEPTLPDVSSAGWHLSRVMSALQVSSIEKFRHIDVEKLIGLGLNLGAVDDGVFFRDDWQSYFAPETAHAHHHHRQDHLQAGHGGRRTGRSSSSPRNMRSRSRTPRLDPHSTTRSHTSPTQQQYQHPAHLQPLIIGDTSADSFLWAMPISYWTSSGVVRRLKAICQSLSKTSGIQRAYDIGSHIPDEEIIDRVLELVGDARVAWPTHCVAEAAKRERASAAIASGSGLGSGTGVWRYVFDQEGSLRGIPHYGADLMYLFDNVPLPASAYTFAGGGGYDAFWDGPFDVDDEEELKENVASCVAGVPHLGGDIDIDFCLSTADFSKPPTIASISSSSSLAGLTPRVLPNVHRPSPLANGSGYEHDLTRALSPTLSPSLSPSLAHHRNSHSSSTSVDTVSSTSHDSDWLTSIVDVYSYARVRDTMQERWIAFAHGEVPWRADKVFVFGPEGETGERSQEIFDGRRRRQLWREALEPLGPALVQKVGVELSRGPASGADRR
ncbi:unnamed protein product [Cyclocybe aegerita]|uniref:Carboxylesterase type B domain-containing protein n=1 Tax=Cyclocybe aegerita TaxID=1973307 RepID=A0A8S0VT90_CYCAE|nr:unnamed protein product [Cyclocybe aegerita]